MLARPKARADHARLLVDYGIAVCQLEGMGAPPIMTGG